MSKTFSYFFNLSELFHYRGVHTDTKQPSSPTLIFREARRVALYRWTLGESNPYLPDANRLLYH